MANECLKYVPEEIHVIETIAWLIVSSLGLYALNFAQVLKECIKESRKENQKPVTITPLEYIFLGVFAVFVVVRLLTTYTTHVLPVRLLMAPNAASTSILLCMIGLKRTVAGPVLGLLCIPYVVKGLFVSFLSEDVALHTSVFNNTLLFAEAALLCLGCLYILCSKNYWGLRMMDDVSMLKWLMCWVILQMNCLCEVRSSGTMFYLVPVVLSMPYTYTYLYCTISAISVPQKR